MGTVPRMMRATWCWWMEFFLVLLKTVKLSIVCLVMRIKFKIDPSSRKRDLAEVTESYNLPIEGFKYLKWRNEYTVSNFFYTWHMIKDYYKTNLQDINKSARLYSSAPDPVVHDAVTGVSTTLLSHAHPDLPLVINFGSCT